MDIFDVILRETPRPNIREIIEKSKGVDFVVMTHDKKEFERLRDVLVDMEYEPSIPLGSLYEMMNSTAKKTNYQCGWRISERKGIAWNPSVEHWKYYYPNILIINQNRESLCFF